MEKDKTPFSIKKILIVGALVVLVPWMFVSASSPQNTPPPKTQSEIQAPPATETKTVSEKSEIPFKTETQSDSSLPLGQTKISREGVKGERVTNYTVTYTNGVESDRKVLSEQVTLQPVSEVLAQGTYVAPVAPAAGCGTGYYVNAYGNCVKSPSSSPSGATAHCKDGTYSYSQTRSGTCSHHGGVAEWL